MEISSLMRFTSFLCEAHPRACFCVEKEGATDTMSRAASSLASSSSLSSHLSCVRNKKSGTNQRQQQRLRRKTSTSMRVVSASSSSGSTPLKTLFALDFDGVVCDSVGESSLSAWKHGVQLWPEIFDNEGALKEKERVVLQLRAVRPVVETGYENTILARALLENLDGYDVESIIKDWPRLSEELMQKWQLDRKTMVLEFGEIRDEWIQSDFKSWLQPNALYEDVPEALKFCTERKDAKVTVVTTKQARFADAILVDMGGVKIPEEDLISTTVSGEPKADVLVRLEETFNKDGAARMIFVEDKLSTLIKVANDKRLTKWDLFFVDWGYNTEDERQVAKHDYRMKLIGKEEFCALLREG